MNFPIEPTEFQALTPADRVVVSQMRQNLNQYKGLLGGPAMREQFDALIAAAPAPAEVTYDAATVGGVAGWWCRPVTQRATDSAVLYLHGGAYVAGSATAYRHFVGQLAARVGADIFVPDYRLAPEHPFPAAVEDAQAAYQGLLTAGRQHIAICGDSAGGGLALTTLALVTAEAARTPGAQLPRAGVVFSPWTDLALASPSMQTKAEADFLVTKDWLAQQATYYLQSHAPHDPNASPVYGRLAGLPPLQVHVGTDEVLRDDSLRYVAQARAAGVSVELYMWEEMPHVFAVNIGILQAAEQALLRVSAFLSKNLMHAATTHVLS
ncbi:alpha/beta hydrolase [Hymenobacter sp. YC55]|uniref:alpha/beta hydrolase n=1 Tax=Hymenobacter sp. YC55 TaxID=3034019 RepID=UPI0023F9C788|nr:alpha/beta hydrolase [Hymenobacter sp. YC55]MDF7815023.1 alpha/beta hydrolase [Hymenobacter sp. YC55]